MVLLIGFLLLVSLVVAALVATLDEILVQRVTALQPLLGLLQFGLSLGVATVDDPEASFWAALGGALRNAFVERLVPQLEGSVGEG